MWTSPESCSIRLSPVFDYKQVLQICRAKFVDAQDFLRNNSICVDIPQYLYAYIICFDISSFFSLDGSLDPTTGLYGISLSDLSTVEALPNWASIRPASKAQKTGPIPSIAEMPMHKLWGYGIGEFDPQWNKLR